VTDVKLRLRMRGDISPLPHTSSWRGTHLSAGTTLFLPLHENGITKVIDDFRLGFRFPKCT
jgi:hypothetical protein